MTVERENHAPDKELKEHVLYTEEEINSAIFFTAKKIDLDYIDRSPILIFLLTGGMYYGVELHLALGRRGRRDITATTLDVGRYGDSTIPSEQLNISSDLKIDIAGKDVIVVDDVYDGGVTLKKVDEFLRLRKPNSIEYSVLAVKKGGLTTESVYIKYTELKEIEGRPWLFGFGMDNEGGKDRNIPRIMAATPEEVS